MRRRRNGPTLALGVLISFWIGFAGSIISDEWTSLTAATVVGVLIGAVGLAAFLATSSTIRRTPSSRRVYDQVRITDTVVTQIFPSDSSIRVDRSETAQALLDRIYRLEIEAEELLNRRLGEKRRSIFDLRADLIRLGIWSQSDVESFDRAIRVRNAIVHLDVNSIAEKDIDMATGIVQDLLDRLSLSR